MNVAAAVSALGATINANTAATAFNPYSGEAVFYLGAFIFEDVCCSKHFIPLFVG